MLDVANKNSGIPNVSYGKQSCVLDRKKALAEYVQRIKREKKLSYREIAAKSGGKISIATANEIANNKHGNITMPTLIALAKGLGVPDQEIIDIAFGNAARDDNDWRESTLYELYTRSKTATKDRKKMIDDVIEVLLDRLEKDRAG